MSIEIQNMLDVLDRCCRKWEVKINCSKTKLMPVGNLSEDTIPICLNSEPIEEVFSFEYLGSILESTCSVDSGQQTTESGNCMCIRCGDTKYLEVVTSALQPRYGYSNHWWCQSFYLEQRPGL